MQALELAHLDDNTTSLTQLERIRKEKDALAPAKNATKKAKAEAEAKVEASQKLQAEVSVDLLKHKDANSVLKKQLDAVAGKRDRLAGKL